MAISVMRGAISGLLTSSQYTLHSRNSSWGWVSWKYCEPTSSSGMCAAIARPGAACAHRQLAGQCGVGGGGERRGFLVTHVFPTDLRGAADRVGETVEAVARYAVHAAHPTGFQCRDHVLRNGWHRSSP
jgi:hypothetical protein